MAVHLPRRCRVTLEIARKDPRGLRDTIDDVRYFAELRLNSAEPAGHAKSARPYDRPRISA